MSCGHGSPGGSPVLSPSHWLSALPLLPAQQHQGCWFKHEISCWGPQQQETKCRASAGQGDPQPQDPPPWGLWWPHRARGISRSLLQCWFGARRTPYAVPLWTRAACALCECSSPLSVRARAVSCHHTKPQGAFMQRRHPVPPVYHPLV